MSCSFLRSRASRLAILILLLLAVMSSCQPSEPELAVATEVIQLGDEQIIITRMVEVVPTATATAPPQASVPEPVSLDIAYQVELPDLNPQRVSNKASLDFAESLFAGLTNFNHATEEIEPELAQSWRVSGDGRTWTFVLREDMYWLYPLSFTGESEATPTPEIYRPVTAQDVVFALRRACDQRNQVADAFLLFVVDGCEELYRTLEPQESDLELPAISAIDERTVEIRLRQPSSFFLTITSLPQFRPIPADLVQEHGERWRDAAGDLSTGWQTPENLVVNGPFLPLGSSLASEELLLRRNPLWPIPIQGNIDEIRIRLQTEEMEIFEAWQNRELDLGGLPAAEREFFLERSPEKARLITNQSIFYVGFNFDSPVFQEPTIRRAFSAAIDRSALVDDMFAGRAQPLRHLTPPGTFGAPPVDEVGVGYSPDFALQQISNSSIRNCKLLPPVRFLISTADLSLLQAELLRSMWVNELGCDEQSIQIEQVEFGSLLSQTNSQVQGERPDMWELAWPSYYPDAHSVLYELLHCTDGENRQNRSCSEVDSILQQARSTEQPQERADLYRTAEREFFAENGSFPVIPLYVRGDYLLVQSWLTFPPALSGGEQFETFVVDQETKRLERSRT